MTAARWAQVRSLVETALPLAPSERDALLSTLRSHDLTLWRDVDRLLAAEADATRIFSPARWQQSAQQTQSFAAGTMMGHYRLLHELGQGGMGTVYLAERADGEYENLVALKVLRENSISGPALDRFRRERQILAGLSHPGIARLLDGGLTEAGQPFAVMEYVEGEPIDQYCTNNNLDLDACLRLFLHAAEAIQYAHQQLILHLDIKPANLLVTDSGQPRLLDFGISRMMVISDQGTLAAETTIQLLTPRYASPEQLAGHPLGVASDVFSLGTLLYRLLTGVLPYPIDDALPLEQIRMIREHAPQLPSQAADTPWAVRLRGDLDLILLQALRKEPGRRYATVAEFAADIQRHLSSRPVRAHKDSLGYRASKFARRNRGYLIAAAVMLVIIIASVAAVVHSAIVARRQEALAQRRLQDVRKLAHSYVFELEPKLVDIPGTIKVRAFILRNALQYLDAMAQEDQNDSSLAQEVGHGYMSVAQVQARTGQPSLSDIAGAWVSLHKSYDNQLRAFHLTPNDLGVRGYLVADLRLMADLAKQEGDLVNSDRYAMQAWELGQPILAAGPRTPRYTALQYVALDLAENRGAATEGGTEADPNGALVWLDRLHAMTVRYAALPVAQQPDPSVPAAMLENEFMVRASVMDQLGRQQEARAAYEQALTTALGGKDPSVIQTIAAMVIRYTYAEYLLEIHDPAAAARVAPPLGPAVRREAGADRQLRLQSAEVLTLHARIHLEQGDVAVGKKMADQAIGDLLALQHEDPSNIGDSYELSNSLADLAKEPALPFAQRRTLDTTALGFMDTYLHTHPQDFGALIEEARAKINLAKLSAQDPTSANAFAQAAADDMHRVLAAHADDPEAARLLDEAEHLKS